MKVILPYPPSVNTYWRNWNGRMVLSPKGRQYKKTVAQLVQANPAGGQVILCIDVFRPRRIGDLDNTLKGILDSLTGLLYNDDKQVVEIHARRFDDKDNPRAEVSIAFR